VGVHIIFSTAAAERELDVRLRSRDATLADLLRAIDGGEVPGTVAIDGRPVDTSVAGLDAGRSFPLSPGRWVLGRDPASDLVLDHDTVSREHCAFTVSGDRVTVTDLRPRTGFR
jgi:S-DNA-T family DNA segregation ATPase FtsK/SpoIIIE